MRRGGAGAGLTLATVSAATFGTSGTFAASLLAIGWTPGAAVTARVVIAALVLTVPALVVVRRARLTPAARRRGTRTVAVYGAIAVAGCQLCYFNAVAHLSVAVALLLEYSGVLLVVLWVWLRHEQRPRWRTVVGGLVALVGLVLVLDVVGHHDVDVVGVLWGLAAAVGLAVYFVISAQSDGALPPLVVAWGGLVFGGVVLGIAGVSGALALSAPRADVILMHARTSWVVPVLGLSLVAAVVAYVTGIAGVRLLGARMASFVGLLEVLFAVAFAWLVLGQSLRPAQLLGGVLVVGGIALVRLDEVGAAADVVPVPEHDVLALDRADDGVTFGETVTSWQQAAASSPE